MSQGGRSKCARRKWEVGEELGGGRGTPKGKAEKLEISAFFQSTAKLAESSPGKFGIGLKIHHSLKNKDNFSTVLPLRGKTPPPFPIPPSSCCHQPFTSVPRSLRSASAHPSSHRVARVRAERAEIPVCVHSSLSHLLVRGSEAARAICHPSAAVGAGGGRSQGAEAETLLCC